jgi:GNAT superfamily N-acetyltransferase
MHAYFKTDKFRQALEDGLQMTSLATRLATPADAEQIGIVHDEAWRAAYRDLLPLALLESSDAVARARQWRVNIESASRAVIVADIGGRIAGFCSLAHSRDAEAGPLCGEITALYVDPVVWRRGYGRGLVSAARAHALTRQWSELTLWVLSANQAALAFYFSLGFRPDGGEKLEGTPPLLEVRYRSVVIAG